VRLAKPARKGYLCHKMENISSSSIHLFMSEIDKVVSSTIASAALTCGAGIGPLPTCELSVLVSASGRKAD
jgi:hypothetical protein